MKFNLNTCRIGEVFRFCLVGAVSFLVDYGLLYVCTECLGLYYLSSSAISFTVSVIVNYWLCLVYVFQISEKQSVRRAVLFIGSSVVGLGLNQLCMFFFVQKLGVYYMVAKIFATGIVMLWNYVMKRKAIAERSYL